MQVVLPLMEQEPHALDGLDLGPEHAERLTRLLATSDDPVLPSLSSPWLRAALLAAGDGRLFKNALPTLLAAIEPPTHGYGQAIYLHLIALDAWRNRHDLLAATVSLNSSLAALDQQDDPLGYGGRVFDTYGQLLHHQGLLQDARIAYERALATKAAVSDFEGIALTQGNLGRLCMALGDFATAADCLRDDVAYVAQHTPNETRLLSTLLTQLGAALVDANDLPAANAALQRSLDLANHNEDGISAAFVGVHLARAALRSGQADTALAHLEHVDALDDATATALPELQGLAALVRAQCLRAQDEIDAAFASFDKASAWFDKAPRVTPVERAELLEAHACAMEAAGESHRAADMLREALRSLDATSAEGMRQRLDDHLRRLDRNAWMLHSAGRFVGHGQIDLLLDEAGRGGFRGQRTEAAVLFSDIRGFTTFSERLDPELLVAWLNRYFGHMTRCVEYFGGRIDKFIGDAVMAIFPPIEGQPHHADRAAQAALFMHAELDRFNRFLPDDLPHLSAGIGLHAGELIAGLIGSPQKRSYTVLGDVVNTASRLEGMTKLLNAPILVSAAVAANLDDATRARLGPLGRYRPRGRTGSVEVYTLSSADLPRNAARQAFAWFHARQFDDAARAFAALARECDGQIADKGYGLHAAAAAQFRDAPPPDSWDGAIILTEK